jgi:hypothetical protein
MKHRHQSIELAGTVGEHRSPFALAEFVPRPQADNQIGAPAAYRRAPLHVNESSPIVWSIETMRPELYFNNSPDHSPHHAGRNLILCKGGSLFSIDRDEFNLRFGHE